MNEELSLLTKNRLIENGVRVDLVCLAEQPLHAVPLLKFPSKSGKEVIYDVPQWLNLSYYSKTHAQSSLFVPRMQVPPRLQRDIILERTTPANSGVTDYEEFDTEVSHFLLCYDRFIEKYVKLSQGLLKISFNVKQY